MDQVFVARQLPELKAQGIGRWIGIRVELHHGIVIGEPGRVCVPCIQGGIFQQAQPPMPGVIRLATTAQPVVPIVWMTAKVLPCTRRASLCQDRKSLVSGKSVSVRMNS